MARKKSKTRAQLPPLDINQRYDVPEAIAYLRTSRSAFYEKLVGEGRIKVIREGFRTFVPGSEIARLSRPEPQAAA